MKKLLKDGFRNKTGVWLMLSKKFMNLKNSRNFWIMRKVKRNSLRMSTVS